MIQIVRTLSPPSILCFKKMLEIMKSSLAFHSIKRLHQKFLVFQLPFWEVPKRSLSSTVYSKGSHHAVFQSFVHGRELLPAVCVVCNSCNFPVSTKIMPVLFISRIVPFRTSWLESYWDWQCCWVSSCSMEFYLCPLQLYFVGTTLNTKLVGFLSSSPNRAVFEIYSSHCF